MRNMAIWFYIMGIFVIASLATTNQIAVQVIVTTFGAISTISGTLQYFPQLIHTIRTREFGSLSIHTLMMQCPGIFCFIKDLFCLLYHLQTLMLLIGLPGYLLLSVVFFREFLLHYIF